MWAAFKEGYFSKGGPHPADAIATPIARALNVTFCTVIAVLVARAMGVGL